MIRASERVMSSTNCSSTELYGVSKWRMYNLFRPVKEVINKDLLTVFSFTCCGDKHEVFADQVILDA